MVDEASTEDRRRERERGKSKEGREGGRRAAAAASARFPAESTEIFPCTFRHISILLRRGEDECSLAEAQREAFMLRH